MPEPTFFCIGAQKGGTRWLYDQLNAHPEFWMPPIKELHFFDGTFNERFRRSNRDRLKRKSQENTLSKRDALFARQAEILSKSLFNRLERYTELFAPRGELQSGDITPAYSTLPSRTIRKIRARLPELKIIYLCRDPVARFWSQYCQHIRQGRTGLPAPDDVNALVRYVDRRGVANRSFPTQTIRRWREHFPAMHICLFDDIRDKPDKARQGILEYLGANPATTSSLDAGFNRKASNKRIEMPGAVREALVKRFADELLACADMLGGAAADWPARYGLK